MTVFAFRFATFLGAFLVFLVQPLVGKQILPWFGGAPAVWSTCLLFFQIGLVLGYAYAHALGRLTPRLQARLHVGLLAVSTLLLPISVSQDWKPAAGDAPVARLLGLLSVTVGIPYVLLSATAPLLQAWFSGVAPSRTPYRLYVASNIGSLLALVAFPVMLEPGLATGGQAFAWSALYLIFIGTCLWCSSLVSGSTATARVPAAARLETAPPVFDRVLWVVLAACGSGLLLATTNQLCQDVAVVPLLWTLPLGLYLVTFILCFAGFYSRPLWVSTYLVTLLASTYVLANAGTMPIVVQAAGLLLLLFAGCMVCHGELVALRPNVQHLTSFYLGLAIGGSIGGIFVALLAPLLFTTYAEFPILLLLVLGVVVASLFRDFSRKTTRKAPLAIWAIPAVAFTIATIVSVNASGRSPAAIVATARNFYGILRVADSAAGTPQALRELYHGRVRHGAQFVDPARSRMPTTYFSEGSGVDVALRQHPRRLAGQPLRVGVIGLGAGTIAAWGRTGDTIRFYELNPQVVDLAHTHFSFLKDSAAAVDVVTGDGRLALEREVDAANGFAPYDVFVVDAFSGDSIPVHLLTRECFALYRRALAPDGVLALHVSNKHLDLRPVVRGLADETGLRTFEIVTSGQPAVAATSSLWMLLTGSPAFDAGPFAVTSGGGERTLIWTDAFSSVLSLLR
jgi:hypothetical protein